MSTKRKPYITEIPATWWQKNPYYFWYFLREMTSLFTIWFSLVLVYGFFCAFGTAEGSSWQTFLHFLRNPVVIILNVISLLAALLHTRTWLLSLPQVSPVKVKGNVIESVKFANIASIVVAVISMIILGCFLWI